MASGVLNDASKTQLLDAQLQASPFDVLYMGLGLNNIDPDRFTTLADLFEAAFVGYSRQRLIQANWSPAILLADGSAFSATDRCVFENHSGSTQGPFYTWFYVNQTLDQLVLAGKLDASFLLADGQTYPLTPSWIKKGA